MTTTPPPPEDPAGYRLTPAGGPTLRTDIIDVYIFRRAQRRPDPGNPADGPPSLGRPRIEFLQLLRAGAPLASTWHPIMGHVEPGETAAACALRELNEEVGLAADSPDLRGLWALEQVHPYFVAPINAIVLSPRFAAEVRPTWEPALNPEHTAARWVHQQDIMRSFMWPGQCAACREILEHLVPEDSLSREALRIR